MEQHEHAQQIFSMMIGGMASGGHLPTASNADGFAELAVIFAEAFARKSKQIGDKADKERGVAI